MSPQPLETQPLLQTIGLKKYFKTPRGDLHAVDDVNIKIDKGKTLGVVGESGCGKTTLGRTILRLTDVSAGEIFFEGKDVLKYNKAEIRAMHKEMQLIFQDPYSSLNPRKSVSEIIREPIIVNKLMQGRKLIDERVRELLNIVGLSPRMMNSYPHELDGGRRQRVGVARALSLQPKLIVCDEPVSALDVSIQAQILNLLMDLQEEMGLSYMFITHDLSVVKHISYEIAVMYLGQCVELALSDELFANPLHPYTKALLNAIPVPDVEMMRKRKPVIRGEVSSPVNPKPGCRFVSRCDSAFEKCAEPVNLTDQGDGHFVACKLFKE